MATSTARARPRGDRDGHGLAALAENSQGAVSSLQAERFDVGASRLRDPKAAQCQQRDQGVLDSRPQTGGDEERTYLVAIESDGVALVVQAGPAHMHRRGDGQKALFFGVAVEAGHGT